MAVGAAAQPAVRDPDPDVARRRRCLERAQLERGGAGARRVVLVRERRPEDAVEVRALVAERELEHVAAVAREDPLRGAHELVELLARRLVVVVVDAAEVDEHGIRRPQLGEELAAPGRQPLVDGRQEPGARRARSGERPRPGRRRCGRDLGEETLDDADRPAAVQVTRVLRRTARRRERFDRRDVEDDLALLGEVLGVGEPVDQAPGEHVDQLDLGIADDEPARRPDRDRDLERELEATAPPRRRDLALALHRLLHREGAGRRARPVVAVEPAGDRVAAEVDDVAAVAVELGDDGVEDAVQVAGQDLRGALRAELGRRAPRSGA